MKLQDLWIVQCITRVYVKILPVEGMLIRKSRVVCCVVISWLVTVQ